MSSPSSSSNPSEAVVINALNHEIRRGVLTRLASGPQTYTSLLEAFGVSTGKLNYHLRLLQGFVEKTPEGSYRTTPLGARALAILQQVRRDLSEADDPLVKEAYVSQRDKSKTFLELAFVSRFNFKFAMLVAVSVAGLFFAITYVAMGGALVQVLPMIVVMVATSVGGVAWILRLKRSAPTFVKQMEALISQDD